MMINYQFLLAITTILLINIISTIMQYKKGKAGSTSIDKKDQLSNQYRQWLRQTEHDNKPLKNPHKINDSLASHQSSIIYEHMKNMSIDDDGPPALLDLSLQINDQDTGQARTNLRTSRDSANNKKKVKNYLKSIYIEEEQAENTYQAKNNNHSNFDTQRLPNNQINHQILSMASSIQNQSSHQAISTRRMRQTIKKEQQSIEATTFQIYSALIQQPKLNPLSNSMTTTTKAVSQHVLEQSSLYWKLKSSKQQLASILVSNNKMLSYVQRLTELQISQHNRIHQTQERKDSRRIDYSMQDGIQIAEQKQCAQILGMLACFMIKIREGSQQCNGLLPQIIKNKQGEITFNFGTPKNNNSIQNLSKYSSSKKQQSSQVNQSQRAINLNKKLIEQDDLLEKIKHEYDAIINNYMTTIAKLIMENKQKQEIYLKSEGNQKNNGYSGKSSPSKNYDKLSTDDKDKSSSGGIMRGDSKVSEIVKIHQSQDKDQQLERLILGSNKLDTIDVFNRLSADSKRKSRSKMGEVEKLQFSFQRQ